MSEQFYSKLVVSSHTLTPHQLNSIIGIKCDESYLIGDLRKPTIIHEKENGWIIKSSLPQNVPLENHIINLLERVSLVKEKIRGLANQPDVEVEFGCIIFTSKRPAIFFTKEQITVICEMGASIDIDLYILPEEEEYQSES